MEQLKIIRTLVELEDLVSYLKDKEFIAFDTETTGVEKDSQIIGYSVCAEVDPAIGYYVINSYWDKQQQKLIMTEAAGAAKSFMGCLVGKSLIMQNSPFDCAMVKNNYGVDLMPSVHTDTLILGHLLNENRANGLKERGVELFGEDARKEQAEMKASVLANGGQLTKACYELYKADADLIAKYGAKDAILTLRVFYNDIPELFEQGLDKFFYEEESMPLLRGPTYDLNTTGLRVDPERLQDLRRILEAEILDAKAYIHREIEPYVKAKYPGTGKTNHFNIAASKQLAWLLFFKLNEPFHTLTKGGKELCKELGLKLPYTLGAKRDFINACIDAKGRQYGKASATGRRKKVGDPWNYIACGKDTLKKYSEKYKWVARLLDYAKATKLLSTYVEGIQSKMRYNVIRPSFLQHGTTSGRYSSRHPNFQNLPRDDKRVKHCIVAREGMAFVGADYSQLEPRVFASVSQDKTLMECFAKGEDFYSVVGAPIWEKSGLSLYKNDANSFAKKHPDLRDKAKVVALATPYGRTAAQQADQMGISIDESQDLINRYFEAYPKVELMMLESHELAKTHGVVYNLYGRPRRIPEAKEIRKIYGNSLHSELPYAARTLLNLAMNHRVQSSGASIMNRAAIAVWHKLQEKGQQDPRWKKAKIVLQVHDELILEVPEIFAEEAASILKECMETTTTLPGVELQAEPKIAKTLADLK